MTDWQPIETAPKDRPILVWHDHDKDPYWIVEDKTLTTYGLWCETTSIRAGPPLCTTAEWGGDFVDEESGEGWGPWTEMPPWWFEYGSDFEKPLNPTHWMPLPEPPK